MSRNTFSTRFRFAAAVGSLLALSALGASVGQELVPVGSVSSMYGNSVAVGGVTAAWQNAGYDKFALVAMPGLEGDENEAVYVFGRGAGVWSQLDRLTPSDAAPGRFFAYGWDVDVDNGAATDVRAVVGAPGDEIGKGAVYVISADHPGGPWAETKLVASDAEQLDNFGIAVAIDDGTIVAGSVLDNDRGTDSGSVYVFTNTGPDTWTETAKLHAPDGVSFDRFGGAVALDGDTLVVGAHKDDDDGPASGSAHVFVRGSGDDWTHQAKLTASDADDSARFGASVAIDGDTIVVGAPFESSAGLASGAAYVFARGPGGTWNETVKLVGTETDGYDTFGAAVDIDSGIIVVRAPFTWNNATYVFAETEPGAWVEREMLEVPGAWPREEFDWWPTMAAIDGDTVLVGVPRETAQGQAHGFCLGTQITTSEPLPIAVQSRPYRAQIAPAGGSSGTWSVADGALPPGLTLDPATGEITGTPTSAGGSGHAHFTARSTSGCGARTDIEVTLTIAHMHDLSRGKYTGFDPLDHTHAAPICHALDLVTGTKLDVKVKVRTKGANLRFEVFDSAGRQVNVSTWMKAKTLSLQLKRFVVPATDRYMVVITPGGPVEQAKTTVKAAAPTKVKGALVLAAQATQDVSFGALDGARVTITVKAARKSSALPEILSVQDSSGTEYLSPGDVIHKKKKAVLKLMYVHGGTLTARIGTRDGTSGGLTWTAKIKEPKGYEFTLPGLPAGD